MERKASDILIELEKKVDTLIKICHNQDMINKNILNRVNEIFSYLEGINTESSHEQDFSDQEAHVVNNSIIEIDEVPLGNRRTSRPESYTEKNKQDTQSKVAVTQRITDSKNKDIFLAEVIVFNEQGETEVKTKTNAVGKWQAQLKPGKYRVNISKIDSVSKNKYEISEDIVIPASNSPVKLSNLVLKK